LRLGSSPCPTTSSALNVGLEFGDGHNKKRRFAANAAFGKLDDMVGNGGGCSVPCTFDPDEN
jgi:hypothetical protein